MSNVHSDVKQAPLKRSAIDTRTSVDTDKRDSFGSVNARFMACSDYTETQVGRNWQFVDTIYDDRGYLRVVWGHSVA